MRKERVDLDRGDGLFGFITLFDNANAVDHSIRFHPFQSIPNTRQIFCMYTSQCAFLTDKVVLFVFSRVTTKGGPGFHTVGQHPAQPVTKAVIQLDPKKTLGSSLFGSTSFGQMALSRTAVALSPDGRFLVYSAGDRTSSNLYLRALRDETASLLEGTEGAWLLGICKRKVVDHIRRRSRPDAATGGELGPDPSEAMFDAKGNWRFDPRMVRGRPESALEREEFWKTFRECLRRCFEIQF